MPKPPSPSTRPIKYFPLRMFFGGRWCGEGSYCASSKLQNGQTLEGDLVFPGVIPADVETVNLVFNPGNEGTSIAGPGVTIPLALK